MEKVRAKLAKEQPRSFRELMKAPYDTKATLHAPNSQSIRDVDDFHRTTKSLSEEDRKKVIDEIGLTLAYRDAPHLFSSEARFPLVLAAEDVPWGEERIVSCQPNITFIGECLRVDPACARFFDLKPMLTANVSCMIGGTYGKNGDWIPAEIFDQWKRWDTEKLNPANRLSMSVRRNDLDPRLVKMTFRAVLFGRVILHPEAQTYPPKMANGLESDFEVVLNEHYRRHMPPLFTTCKYGTTTEQRSGRACDEPLGHFGPHSHKGVAFEIQDRNKGPWEWQCKKIPVSNGGTFCMRPHGHEGPCDEGPFR